VTYLTILGIFHKSVKAEKTTCTCCECSRTIYIATDIF